MEQARARVGGSELSGLVGSGWWRAERAHGRAAEEREKEKRGRERRKMGKGKEKGKKKKKWRKRKRKREKGERERESTGDIRGGHCGLVGHVRRDVWSDDARGARRKRERWDSGRIRVSGQEKVSGK